MKALIPSFFLVLLCSALTAQSPDAHPQNELNAANCHTYDWLLNATVDQIKTCVALYPVAISTAPPSAQTQSPDVTQPTPPSYANYTIMLVNPVANAGAVVLMHTPNNSLEYVDVKQIQAALNNGYVPVRSAEIIDAINYLHAENDRLTAENARLKGSPATPAPVVVIAPQAQPAAPSQAQIEAEQRAEAAARRQQIIQ